VGGWVLTASVDGLNDDLTLLTSSESDLCLERGFRGGVKVSLAVCSVTVFERLVRLLEENKWFNEDERDTLLELEVSISLMMIKKKNERKERCVSLFNIEKK
jgi:hypothetical protein